MYAKCFKTTLLIYPHERDVLLTLTTYGCHPAYIFPPQCQLSNCTQNARCLVPSWYSKWDDVLPGDIYIINNGMFLCISVQNFGVYNGISRIMGPIVYKGLISVHLCISFYIDTSIINIAGLISGHICISFSIHNYIINDGLFHTVCYCTYISIHNIYTIIYCTYDEYLQLRYSKDTAREVLDGAKQRLVSIAYRLFQNLL